MAYKSMDLTLFFTLFVFALLSTETIDGFSVELIHPNSPSNPYRNSQSRAVSILSRLGDSSKFKTDIKPFHKGYVMKYSIGTPPIETYGIAHTSSDLTWLQCKPCINCFPQSLPIFDPKESKSYKTVACDLDACSLDSEFRCSNDNVCQYHASYGYYESNTNGDVATDTLTIGNTSLKDVVLGCGHRNNVSFLSGIASGIVGLGYSNISILKQLNKEIGGKFAYCLSSQPNSKSYISFGTDAIVKGHDAVSTPFYQHDGESYYWLSLESMSVGDKNFPLKPPISTDYDSNIIIDSSLPMTYVPSYVFYNMTLELMKHIPWTPIKDPQDLFRLCYSTSEKIKVPKIVAHFEIADVELSPRGLFQEVEEGISCFTIVPSIYKSDDMLAFGWPSQVDYLVGYDLKEKLVTFKPADCSKF